MSRRKGKILPIIWHSGPYWSLFLTSENCVSGEKWKYKLGKLQRIQIEGQNIIDKNIETG